MWTRARVRWVQWHYRPKEHGEEYIMLVLGFIAIAFSL